MKLDSLKSMAARKVGTVLASEAALRVVSDPRVQGAMLRALNARGELREAVERRVSQVASALDLVTREDVAGLRRTIRNLEDSLEEMREELAEARAAAEEQAHAAAAAATADAAGDLGAGSRRRSARGSKTTAS